MARIARTVARLVRASKSAWRRRWSFFAVSALVFFASSSTLARFDLLPANTLAVLAAPESPLVTLSAIAAKKPIETPEDPVRITIEAVGLDALIANPTSTDIGILDDALLSGAVRYPTSARLGENGNVVLFGHSSYLPIVTNQNFKAFNGIEKLVKGDRIEVLSGTRIYVYEVEDVREASAEEDGISLATLGKTLTLATCDSFGSKTDRFIVTAEFVESHANGIVSAN